MGRTPKVRDLKSSLLRVGCSCKSGKGKGSHTVWSHPLLPYSITLSGKDGDDAHHYQVRDVRKALRDLEEKEKE